MNQSEWHGACLDTGAETTVAGLQQSKAYCRFTGVKVRPKKKNHRYIFDID